MCAASDAFVQKTGAALPDRRRAKVDAAQAALPKADEMQAQAKQLESAVSIAEALERERGKSIKKAQKQFARLLADGSRQRRKPISVPAIPSFPTSTG